MCRHRTALFDAAVAVEVPDGEYEIVVGCSHEAGYHAKQTDENCRDVFHFLFEE